MIFNTFAYFIVFLVPAAILFRLVRPAAQPWVCLIFGAAFFAFFSLVQIGGVAGASYFRNDVPPALGGPIPPPPLP